MSHLLPPNERVLPTLNRDGSRRWIRPRLYHGRYHARRQLIAWTLMVVFAALPFLRLNGRPLVLLDIAKREFTLFGAVFLPTEGALFMLLLLAIFVAIVAMTAVLGRVWCGYGCPQTVYLEFLFRPIERWLEGSPSDQAKLDRQSMNPRRLLKYVIYAGLSLVLANLFLSYFVGVETLSKALRHSPAEHPTAFLVVVVTTALVFFDFAYFREQMCTVVCPYARLQSALVDGRSLVIAYDAQRGEPRRQRAKRADKEADGDCINCRACVVTCPTGIDIRDGLQLECVACAQCIDACDTMMDKVGKPRGLIRYGSQAELALQPSERRRVAPWSPRSLLRGRTIVYSVIFAALVVGLVFATSTRRPADVTLLRGLVPFELNGGRVQNQIRVKIQNRTDIDREFEITLLDADGATLIAPENPLNVKAHEHRLTSTFVMAPPELFDRGVREVRFRVMSVDYAEEVPYKLLGPTP